MFRKKFGKTYPIVDTHMHIGVNAINTFIAEQDLIPAMDDGRVDIQILFQVNEGFTHETPSWNPYVGNDYVAKIQKMFPDRVIGLATLNPWWQSPRSYQLPFSKRGKPFDLVKGSPTIDELERCILKLGLWGLKMHPLEHGYHVGDPTIVNPIMDRLVECQEKTGRKLLVGVHCAGDSLFNSPDALADLAERYPEILFLAYHSGFIWGGSTLASTLGRLENVKLDLTTCSQRSVVSEAYEKFGAGKFTVGSDMPFASYSMARAIANDIFEKPEERELALGGNLTKYLGIQVN
jgi:hypothetical protein